MNKLFLLITVIVGLLSASCSNDDEPALGSNDLIHTTWSGTDVCYEDGDEIASVSFIVTFLTESEGKYIYLSMKMAIQQEMVISHTTSMGI